MDIKKINGLRYIKEDGQGGLQIGALTKLAEVADSPLIQQKYPMLAEAVGKISSPELRNASTVGGEMLQQVWCQYLRGGYSCYGAIGDNSYYHSAMGGRLCYAVYPGDIATALISHDAWVKLATPFGTKELTVEQLVPGDMVVDGKLQSHAVRFNEILTEVTLRHRSQGSRRRSRGCVRNCRASRCGTHESCSAREGECSRACYRCLLSYANQPDHPILDRFLVRDFLIRLTHALTTRAARGRSYDEQYSWLLEYRDPSSNLEAQFLDALHKSRRRLPDHAQFRPEPEVYAEADFYYERDGLKGIAVFIDGPHHDEPAQREGYQRERSKLEDLGYRVVVIRFDKPFAEQFNNYAKIFGPGLS